jgi:hypothetical protein
VSWLNKVDFPTFGRPTIAITGIIAFSFVNNEVGRHFTLLWAKKIAVTISVAWMQRSEIQVGDLADMKDLREDAVNTSL